MGLGASAEADEEASLGRSASSYGSSSPHASDVSIPSPPTLANRLPQAARGPGGQPASSTPPTDRSRVLASQRSLASQRPLASQRSVVSSSFVSGTQRSSASGASQSARSPDGPANQGGDQTGRSLTFTERSSAYYTESANTDRSVTESAEISGGHSGDYTERSARSGQDTERSDRYTSRSGGADYTNRSSQYTGRSSQYSEYTDRSGQESGRSARSSNYSRITEGEEEEEDASEYTPQFSGSMIEILSLSRSRSGSITGSQYTGSQLGKDTFRSGAPVESHRTSVSEAASKMGGVLLPTDANKSFRASTSLPDQNLTSQPSTSSMGMFSALVAAAGNAVAALESAFEGEDQAARLGALRLKVVDMKSAQQAMNNEYLQLMNELRLLKDEHKRLTALAEELSKQ